MISRFNIHIKYRKITFLLFYYLYKLGITVGNHVVFLHKYTSQALATCITIYIQILL